MWEIWIVRNAKCFNNDNWNLENIFRNIWCGLQDYARIAWNEAKSRSRIRPSSISFKRYDATWGSNRVLCRRAGDLISWSPLLIFLRVVWLPSPEVQLVIFCSGFVLRLGLLGSVRGPAGPSFAMKFSLHLFQKKKKNLP